MNPRPETLVLASTSPYRAELLGRLRLPFEIQRVAIDESSRSSESAAALSQRLSIEKAKALSDFPGDYLSIGSDQVAACDGRLLGKPITEARARDQLRLISGKTVTFYTGVALWRPRTDSLDCQVVATKVSMRALSDIEISAYITLDQPLDCAGSFKWEALGISLFNATEGPDPTALQGLPLIKLAQMLRDQGYRIP